MQKGRQQSSSSVHVPCCFGGATTIALVLLSILAPTTTTQGPPPFGSGANTGGLGGGGGPFDDSRGSWPPPTSSSLPGSSQSNYNSERDQQRFPPGPANSLPEHNNAHESRSDPYDPFSRNSQNLNAKPEQVSGAYGGDRSRDPFSVGKISSSSHDSDRFSSRFGPFNNNNDRNREEHNRDKNHDRDPAHGADAGPMNHGGNGNCEHLHTQLELERTKNMHYEMKYRDLEHHCQPVTWSGNHKSPFDDFAKRDAFDSVHEKPRANDERAFPPRPNDDRSRFEPFREGASGRQCLDECGRRKCSSSNLDAAFKDVEACKQACELVCRQTVN